VVVADKLTQWLRPGFRLFLISECSFKVRLTLDNGWSFPTARNVGSSFLLKWLEKSVFSILIILRHYYEFSK
jgi:hypothetical protein